MSDITRTRPNADQMDRLIENVKAVADAVYAESDMSFLAMLDESNYKTTMKKWFTAHGAAAMTDLTALCDKWYTLTRTGFYGGVRFNQPVEGESMSSDGTRTGDCVGKTCVPSTETVAGQDDFAGIPLFAPMDCNVYLDEDGKPHITAIDGIAGGFERYNESRIVGVLQMTGWVKFVDDSSGWGIDYTDNIGMPGFHPLPEAVDLDGTVRTWVVHGKYGFGDNWSCCSGVKTKLWNVSYNSELTGVHSKWGSRYCGGTSADDAFLKIMLWLKYAQLDSDRVLHGCCGYNLEYQPALAETGVERILLTPSQAAGFLVGSAVVLASAKRAQANVVDRAKVTKVENVEIGGTTYGAVYVDNGGVTFDTTTDMWLDTIAWWTGSTDNVLGNDGGINPADDRYPVKIQGIEYMVGCYEVMGDTILSFAEIGGEKVQVANVCRDASKLATSVTADYITAGYGVPRPATAGWTWAKRMGFDSNMPEVLIPSVNGASSSTGTRDGFYEEADTATGLREWRRFGSLNIVLTNAGLSCGYGYNGLGNANWSFGGRLSVTGNRGEFQAAA